MSRKHQRGPTWLGKALGLVSVLVPEHQREFLLGDLEESARRRDASRFRQSVWWARQLASVVANAPRWHWETRREQQRLEAVARSRARGSAMSAKENIVQGLWSDLRFVGRQLRRSPGFVLTSVLVLGLGLGANLTIFTLANAVLLKPPEGVSSTDGLFRVLSRSDQRQAFEGSLSYPYFVDIRDALDGDAEIAAHDDMAVGVRVGKTTRRLRGSVVSGNYFRILGVEAQMGRTLLPGDDQELMASPVVVVSHSFWVNHTGADPDILNQTLSLNGTSFQIVGVTRPGFRGLERFENIELWVPMAMQPIADPMGFDVFSARESTWMGAVGRRTTARPLDALTEKIKPIERNFSDQNPNDTRRREFALAPGVGPDPEDQRAAELLMGILLGVVSLVLVIACANVANLVLARSNRRVGEIALRRALGAGQGRVVRLLLTESVVLAILAAVVGLAAAASLGGVMGGFLPDAVTTIDLDLSLDHRVVLYSLVLALASAILFGLGPALGSSRRRPYAAMARSGPSGKSRFRTAMVIAQLALSVVLLMSASLLLQTMRKLDRVPSGVETAGVLTAAVDVKLQAYTPDEAEEFFRVAVQSLQALPQVESVAFATSVPLSGGSDSYGGLLIDGNDPPPDRPGFSVKVNTVTPQFFETVGIDRISGRNFGSSETPDSPRVVMVNRAFKERFWPENDVLGRTISFPAGDVRESAEVVGMVADAHYRSLSRDPEPMIYLPMQQAGNMRAALLVKGPSGGDPLALTQSVRAEVAKLDPDLPVFAVAPLQQIVDDSLWQQRMVSSLLSVFGVLALLLAAVGLYGVIACLVSERRRELGIRLAIGAKPSELMRRLLGQSLKLTLIALALGLVLSVGVGKALSSFLHQVRPVEPGLMLLVIVVLLLASVVASLGPMIMAARLHPATVLRSDG